MAKIILKTDQTETAEADILGEDSYGRYNITLEVKGTTPVFFQRRVAKDKPFRNARFNDTEITLKEVGDNFDVDLTKDFDYRCVTETAGAEVWIAKHDPHG